MTSHDFDDSKNKKLKKYPTWVMTKAAMFSSKIWRSRYGDEFYEMYEFGVDFQTKCGV